jgi:hypothetical protein
MLKFQAHRISSGNKLFPDKLELDSENITYYKGNIVGYQSTIISLDNIASVSIGSGIFFVEIIIETIGGKRISANGFKKSDAKSVVGLLTFNKKTEKSINQNIIYNNAIPIISQSKKHDNNENENEDKEDKSIYNTLDDELLSILNLQKNMYDNKKQIKYFGEAVFHYKLTTGASIEDSRKYIQRLVFFKNHKFATEDAWEKYYSTMQNTIKYTFIIFLIISLLIVAWGFILLVK